MKYAEFQEAQTEHVVKTLERAGMADAATRSIDRALGNQIRLLDLRGKELLLLGKTEAARCLATAKCAIEDAREEMGES